jgi:hypothetical protein
MLQHRLIDEAKPRGSWVAKLRQAAHYAVETLPPDQFSSAKGAGFSEEMRKRALSDTLPSLFNIAALYEDHFARHKLYEGTRRTDPGDGTHVTWHRPTRPPRQTAPPRERGRQTKALRMKSDVNASGSETEVDDTMTRAHLQNSSGSMSRQHAPETPAPTVPSSTTSKISFGQHMHDLRLNEEMDAKMPSHARHNDQALVQNMYPSNMPMHYPTSHAGYNFPVFQYPHPAQYSVGSRHVPSFAHPLYVFDAPCPPQDDRFAVPMAYNNAGFFDEYEGAFPLTPMSDNRPFHGLPLDLNAKC